MPNITIKGDVSIGRDILEHVFWGARVHILRPPHHDRSRNRDDWLRQSLPIPRVNNLITNNVFLIFINLMVN